MKRLLCDPRSVLTEHAMEGDPNVINITWIVFFFRSGTVVLLGAVVSLRSFGGLIS
jgi:hypothetical protein